MPGATADATDERLAGWFERSAAATDSAVTPNAEVRGWLAERAKASAAVVTPIPFAELTGWSFQPDAGTLRHSSGRFFAVDGVRVKTDRSWISEWTQPIIVQPEVGVLGIVVKEIDGVPHLLMQAKVEPGNVNGVQLSPTVQATRSNYLGVHNGAPIRYLEYFTDESRRRVLVDVLQSEQGAWFLHKRNRNIVVEVFDDIEPADDFRWLTLGQIGGLLAVDNMVNMDSRTVLSCLSMTFDVPSGSPADPEFAADLRVSASPTAPSRHSTRAVLNWLTELRSRRELIQQRVPLNATMEGGWYRTAHEIAHESGSYFRVIAVSVSINSREVRQWTQPLVAPEHDGLLAFVTRRIDGVLHVLMQARFDAGSLNGAELAPTVHCAPGNYRDAPFRPPYLDYVLAADKSAIRYDVVQSEEGGRFYHASNRNMVISADEDFPLDVPDGYRWMTLSQLSELLRHSNYLNVEARGLLACLRAIA